MIVPTSPAQERAAAQGTLPPLEQIRDRVWALATAMPGHQVQLQYTLTYLLRSTDGRIHVVDPGWDSVENFGLLVAALDELDGEVGSIIVTHLHPDHLGMAPRLRTHCGAPIVLHERELEALQQSVQGDAVDLAEWGVPAERWPELDFLRGSGVPYSAVTPDIVVRGAVDELSHPGLHLQVLHTPGHTTGSICLRLPAERLLLTGDHVLPVTYAGIGLGGRSAANPIADYFDSLERLTAFDDHEVLPGHQYRFLGLADRMQRILAHHRRRTAEVAAVLRAQSATAVHDVAASLTWSRSWDQMRGFFFYSSMAQTAMHIDLLRRTPTPSADQPLPTGHH